MGEMNVGMLWFENDKGKPVERRIAEAVAFYRQKYGKEPNLCMVHTGEAPEGQRWIDGVEVKGNRSVLPNHYWVGVKG
jgi:hypothetical protein